MKRKITIEEYDDAQGQGQPGQQVADQGQRGDTQLAHVNPWEEALLRKLGGAGTRNPSTGLKQFYINPATGLEEDFFNMPLDIMPTSSTVSSSSSGLPTQYRDQLLSSLMPQLQQSITDMPGYYDKYTSEALGSYQQMMQNALKTDIPKAIAGLSNRGILSSREGENVLGNVYSTAAMDAANKGYMTAMQSALMKANMPTILSQVAQLGTGTQSNQYSYAADPTVMYRTMADLIKAMM